MIIAIDPGINGAIAFYWPDSGFVQCPDMPTVGEGRGRFVDPGWLAHMVRAGQKGQVEGSQAVVEKVRSRPGQGVASTFKFGHAYGTALGVLAGCGIPAREVAPGEWKKHFGLTQDKKASLELARIYFPLQQDLFKRVKDADRAEAALMALWLHQMESVA